MELVDTHAHLNDNRFHQDVDDVLSRAETAGVRTVIVAGYNLSSTRSALALAESRARLWATAGIHPHEADSADEQAFSELQRLAGNKKVVALGEMGLDYYYDHSPRPVQQAVFRRQVQLACAISLPLIIHDREAHDDVLAILREEGASRVGGVMHCFSGDTAFAAHCLELGLYISLAGPVTFKNAHALAEVAKYVPLDRLLLETDAPYLAPVPWRGKRNEPAYLTAVATRVAELRGISADELCRQTSENAIKLFNLT